MTPDERDRLVRAETRVEDLRTEVTDLRSSFEGQLVAIREEHRAAFVELSGKIDLVLQRVTQADAIWWVITKASAVLAALAGLAVTVWHLLKQ